MFRQPYRSCQRPENRLLDQEFYWYRSVVMQTFFKRFASDESGATAIEYGLIAAIVGIGIVVGLGALRDGLNSLFNNVNTQLSK